MVRLAVNEMTTLRWSFEEDVHNYLAAGFDGIGIWRQKFDDFGEEAGIDFLAESGIDVSSLMWVGGFTGHDGVSYADSIEDGVNVIRLGAAIGASCVVAYTGGRGGHTHNHARRLALTALQELGQLADDLDVTLAIEPMHPGCGQDWTFVSSLDATLEMIDRLSLPSIKMVLDACHLGHDPDFLARVGDIVPHIALVQLGDARSAPRREPDRTPLGKGHLPLRELIGCLGEHGYRGFYEVELMGQEFEGRDYWDILRESRIAVTEICSGVPSV